MYRRILVPLDGSKLSERALSQATRLCPQQGELILLQVIRPPLPVMTPDIGMTLPVVDVDEMVEEARQYLEGLVARLKEQGFEARAEVVEGDNVADTIVQFARDHDVSLIVQSTHGRGGLSRLVFGSVSEAVLRKAPCPVMFIRAEEEEDAD